MLLSRPCTYAIRAMTYLSMQPPGKASGTREISKQENMPNSFLGKVLLQLRRGRLLRSYKGLGGGNLLALPPEKINLLMIFRCINGDELLEKINQFRSERDYWQVHLAPTRPGRAN